MTLVMCSRLKGSGKNRVPYLLHKLLPCREILFDDRVPCLGLLLDRGHDDGLCAFEELLRVLGDMMEEILPLLRAGDQCVGDSGSQRSRSRRRSG